MQHRLLLLLMLAASAQLWARPTVTANNRDALRAEIKQRCQQQMGEYGAYMVLGCMKQDWAAAQQIMEYRTQHPDISQRCLSQMREYGFDMVAGCIEQDASAAKQIDDW